jgi:hypothetical protein
MAPCLTAAGSSCGSCICVVTAVAWFGQLLWLQRRTTAYLMLHGLEPAASGSPAAASGSRAVPCRACWKPCRAVTAGDGGTPCADRRAWWLLLLLLLHTSSGLMLGDCCSRCAPRPAPCFSAAGSCCCDSLGHRLVMRCHLHAVALQKRLGLLHTASCYRLHGSGGSSCDIWGRRVAP